MRKSKGWSLCSCSSAMERCVLSLTGLSPVSTWCTHAHQSKLQAAHGSLKDSSEHKDFTSPQCHDGSVKWFITQTPLPLSFLGAAPPKLAMNNRPKKHGWHYQRTFKNEMLNACSYCVRAGQMQLTPLFGRLADLLEFSRNFLINTSYSSTRKNTLSKTPHSLPKSNNSLSDLLLK